MKSMSIFTISVAAFLAGALHAEDLDLDRDKEIVVNDGQVISYDALTGGAFTLTKKGGGTLMFKTLANQNASIVLDGGTLKVSGETVAPAAFTQAIFAADAGTSEFKDDKGKSAAADYVGKVSVWGNLNNLSPVTAENRNTQQPTRLAAAETVSGLPLIDFGSQWVYEAVNGYGGSMAMYDSMARSATNLNDVVEVMVVAMDTEDVKTTIADYGVSGNNTRATPFVGSSDKSTPNFARCNRTENGVNSGIQSDASVPFKPVAQGAILLDGVEVSNTTPFPDGLHLLELRPTQAVQVSSLAAERTSWRGGVRLGAVALFTSALSEADRKTVRNYLLTRWVPVPVRHLELKDGTTLMFENAAGIHAKTLAYSGESVIVGGTLTCDTEGDATGKIVPADGKWRYGVGARGQLPSCARRNGDVSFYAGWYSRPGFVLEATPWFHVDASSELSLTMEPVNGTNFISSWADADGGAIRAKTFSTDVNKPFLRTGFLRGRNVVDYGAYSVMHKTVGGWGAAQQWVDGADKTATCSNLREVLTVAADTEDLVTNHDNILQSATDAGVKDQAKRGVPFIGDTTNAHFLRGNRADLQQGIPVLLSTVTPYSTASVCLDGTNVANDVAYPEGFHLVDIRPGMDGCTGNAFARDRKNVFGGTRIAEFYVFTSELSEEDRAGLTNKLMVKWLGAESADVVTYENLLIDVAARYMAEETRVVVSNSFGLSGQMTVSSLEVHGRAAFATNAVFTGRLRLADGATLTLDGVSPTATEPIWIFDELSLNGGTVTVDFCSAPRSQYAGHPVPVLRATSVSGVATFVAGGAFAECDTKFEWCEGVLYATVRPKGLILIVR